MTVIDCVPSFRQILPLMAVVIAGAACHLPGDTDHEAPIEQRILHTRRGNLERRLVLTGTLEAVDNTLIQVPQTTERQITLQWLAQDGAEVHQGEAIAEFDPSPFSTALESSRNQVLAAGRTLDRLLKEAEASAEESDIQLERVQAAFEKAKLDAEVPPEIRSRQEHEQAQLALEQARAALLKSKEDRKAQRKASATEVQTQEEDLLAAEQELERAEQAVAVVRLTAPKDGILVIADHPWEGRRIQVGDTLWTDLAVAKIPDLTHMQVGAVLWDVDDGTLARGMEARCTLDAVPGRHFQGRISDITPVAQEVRRLSLRRGFNVLIDLGRVDPEIARPGMSIHVDIALPGATDAVLVPRSCLVFDDAGTSVTLEDGTRTAVTLGACSSQECVVTSGLESDVALEHHAG